MNQYSQSCLMDVPKEYNNHRPLPGQTGNRSRQVEAVDGSPQATDFMRAIEVRERRRQADRRRRQRSFKGPERRKQSDRRRIQLLNPRNGRPDTLEGRQGRNLDLSV